MYQKIINYSNELSLTENAKSSFSTMKTNKDSELWDVDEKERFWEWDNNPKTDDLT